MPASLPPVPALDLATLLGPLEQAQLALGRLEGISTQLPAPLSFLYTCVRKEALLSSQIEGTQSSIQELLLFELPERPGVPTDDVIEVSNYIAALEHGLKRLDAGFPLSNRLLREVHGRLMASGRGSEHDPGNFRRSQNWIGGTRPGNATCVPPPPQEVATCMSELERFLHASVPGLSALLRAGLAHVQFETIHPFLDGNGRVGRLLITLLLCHYEVLDEPLLYLSLYFKQQRPRYYELLDTVRRTGDWEAWLVFFLDGVAQTAAAAVSTAQRLPVAVSARSRADPTARAGGGFGAAGARSSEGTSGQIGAGGRRARRTLVSGRGQRHAYARTGRNREGADRPETQPLVRLRPLRQHHQRRHLSRHPRHRNGLILRLTQSVNVT